MSTLANIVAIQFQKNKKSVRGWGPGGGPRTPPGYFTCPWDGSPGVPPGPLPGTPRVPGKGARASPRDPSQVCHVSPGREAGQAPGTPPGNATCNPESH